ncbi:MAG: glycoside hydrolase family 5 protein [Lachnospiraceae bacterium]|nr:glycoside hydrolase family 5 protein [Lachnospiraceae bacterium]
MKRFFRQSFSKAISAVLISFILMISVSQYFLSGTALAAENPTAENVKTNIWGSGGQISFDLKGCSGYLTITVVVEFNADVKSPSGWGFDSYTANGKQVTAVVRADGANSWGFNSNVGIQVDGSGLSSAKVVSVTGSGTYTAPANTNNNNNNNNQNNQNNQNNNSEARPEFSSPAVSTYGTAGDDWLTTDGSKIVDMNGNQVWLTGLNWFGYNTGTNLFDGLWNAELESSIVSIADHGFNLMRIPMSAELLLDWKKGNYPTANYNHAYNSNLNSLNSLEIFDYVLTLCEQNGIKVMIDIHSANTDASGHNHPVWYTDKISEDQYIEALKWIADRYKNFDTIVAIDLKNEPHGKPNETPHAIWNDSNDANNWKRVAERAGNAILDINPHMLIVVEGIQIYPIDPASNNFSSTSEGDYYNTWWGGNLMAVKDYPIDFGDEARNSQIVYSPHDYGPLVYQQPWFDGGFTYDSLYNDVWHDYWLYIAEEDIAPILIGEWGGFMSGDNLKWMEYLRDLIGKENLNHTFWCYNANSGDTGGLVKDDFKTWDDEKYALVETVLWKNDAGKFIGLDHKVALGANGISLSDHSGNAPEPVLNAGTGSDDSSSATVSETNTVSGGGTEGGSASDVSQTDAANAGTGTDANGNTPAAAQPGTQNNGSSANSGILITLLLLSVVMLIIVVILNVNKYRIRQLDNEFEKRINTEYKGPRGNDNSPK